MKVQETNIKTRMKSFDRVTAKHKSYYPHAEGISQNSCNSTSRPAPIFYYFEKYFMRVIFTLSLPIQNRVKDKFFSEGVGQFDSLFIFYGKVIQY